MSEEKKEKEKSAEPTEELKETGSANLEGSRDNHTFFVLHFLLLLKAAHHFLAGRSWRYVRRPEYVLIPERLLRL